MCISSQDISESEGFVNSKIAGKQGLDPACGIEGAVLSWVCGKDLAGLPYRWCPKPIRYALKYVAGV